MSYAGSMPNKVLGQRIQAVRAVWGKTLREVGDHVGTSHVTVFKWEAGRLRPAEPVLKTLAAYFGFPGERWFDGDIYWDALVATLNPLPIRKPQPPKPLAEPKKARFARIEPLQRVATFTCTACKRVGQPSGVAWGICRSCLFGR